MVSNANIGPKPNAEHATVQMRRGVVRGFSQPVGMRRMAAPPVSGFDSRAVPHKDDPVLLPSRRHAGDGVGSLAIPWQPRLG